jgi:hypothetical protein
LRCFDNSLNKTLLYYRVLHPVARNIIKLCREYSGYIIKYFVNCCEKEGIIYSLIKRYLLEGAHDFICTPKPACVNNHFVCDGQAALTTTPHSSDGSYGNPRTAEK